MILRPDELLIVDDNLDARVEGYEAFREERSDADDQWGFHKIFDRNIFLGPTTIR